MWKILIVLATLGFASASSSQSPQSISPQARLLMASRIYHVVSTFFPGLSQEKFDADHEHDLGTILRSTDRREFDLASMKLIADLHDGHSRFYDNWLDHTYGQPINFLAYPLGTNWTVVRSLIDSIHVGDVITATDDTPMQDFFTRNRTNSVRCVDSFPNAGASPHRCLLVLVGFDRWGALVNLQTRRTSFPQ